MKIVNITCSSKGGAGIAALRLHNSLREDGNECAFVSKDLTINYDGQILESSFFEYRKPTLWDRLRHKVRYLVGFDRYAKLKEEFHSKKDQMSYEVSSLPFSVYALEDHPLVKTADVIHFHWMGGILDYPTFFNGNEKPLVWTFHDRNPFQGIFHYQHDEAYNEAVIGSLDQEVKRLKQTVIQQLTSAVMVSPSTWLKDAAVASGFFSKELPFKVIPNGIDLVKFSPKPIQEVRKEHQIPEDAFVLLFTADNLTTRRKGSDLLINALQKVSIPVTLLTIGKGTITLDNPSVTVINFGYVENSDQMSKCYSMANFFVLPSIEDNLPNTMLESFACGTPIISFKTGGMAEYIVEDVSGKFALEMNQDSLRRVIESAFRDKALFRSETIREFAEDKFNFKTLANNYLRVYQSLNKS
ncbi:MAG: glycosyltransferase [Bacteroidota bacterium]